MQAFEYTVVVEAETKEQADIVIAERVGYDEDLTEYGVPDYRIYTCPGDRKPGPQCACAVNRDGSVTTFMCPVHADVDPCYTTWRVTGKRRTGTIRRGVCTNCGHVSK